MRKIEDWQVIARHPKPADPGAMAYSVARWVDPVGTLPARERRAARSCGLGQHIANADQVVDRGGEGEQPADAPDAPVPRLAEQRDGLQPAEDLFDAFAHPLAYGVARMPGGALIDRTAAVRGVLCHVRRHPEP